MTTHFVLAFDLAAGLLLVAAAVSDIRRFTIPNRIVLLLVALFVVRSIFALASGEASAPLLLPVPIAVAVFVAGAFAFQRGWLGGGDVKLLAAVVLCLPAARVVDFLTLVALLGGVLATVVLASARLASAGQSARPASSLHLPYGVAISGAGIFTLFGVVNL